MLDHVDLMITPYAILIAIGASGLCSGSLLLS